MRILNKISYPRPSLPRVLSIDEFKGNAEGVEFQCILTDSVRKRVLDILPSRKSEILLAYFLQYPLEQRKRVEHLVRNMSHLFRDVLSSCFPNAKIVMDKFHVCSGCGCSYGFAMCIERLMTHNENNNIVPNIDFVSRRCYYGLCRI